MESFGCYHHIWQKDKEETIEKFMMGNPLLSEVESQILLVKDLEMKVSSEPEYICVGAIALYTGKVRFSTSHSFPLLSRGTFFLAPVGRRNV